MWASIAAHQITVVDVFLFAVFLSLSFNAGYCLSSVDANINTLPNFLKKKQLKHKHFITGFKNKNGCVTCSLDCLVYLSVHSLKDESIVRRAKW